MDDLIILGILGVIPVVIGLFKSYLPKLTARKKNLHKLSSLSKVFRSFFDIDSLITAKKDKKFDLELYIFFIFLGYMLFIVSYIIPYSYYFYIGILIIFITFIPVSFEIFYNKKDIIIRYSIMKSGNVLYLLQILSLILLFLKIPSLFYPVAIGVSIGYSCYFIY